MGKRDQQKVPGKRRRRCDGCDSLRFDVKRMLEPFEQDVNNKEVWVNYCEYCARESCMEI